MEIFQEILKIVLTGLAASIFLLIAVRLGLLPILYLSPTPPPEDEDQ